MLIFSATVRQLLAPRRWAGLAALALLPGLVLTVVGTSVTADRTVDLYHGLMANMLLAVAVPVTTLIVASAALGEERRRGTLPYLLLKPVPRTGIVGAKGLAALTVAIFTALLGVALAALVAGAAAGAWNLALPTLGTAALASLGYVGLFLPLGYLTSRATLIGLAYIFLWEGALASAVSGLTPSSIWRTGLSAYLDFVAPRPLAGELPTSLGTIAVGAGGALLKVIAVAAVGVVFTIVLLRSRDNV